MWPRLSACGRTGLGYSTTCTHLGRKSAQPSKNALVRTGTRNPILNLQGICRVANTRMSTQSGNSCCSVCARVRFCVFCVCPQIQQMPGTLCLHLACIGLERAAGARRARPAAFRAACGVLQRRCNERAKAPSDCLSSTGKGLARKRKPLSPKEKVSTSLFRRAKSRTNSTTAPGCPPLTVTLPAASARSSSSSARS